MNRPMRMHSAPIFFIRRLLCIHIFADVAVVDFFRVFLSLFFFGFFSLYLLVLGEKEAAKTKTS